MYSNLETQCLVYHYYLKDYIVMSISTNGTDSTKHEVLEICALRIKDGVIIEKFQEYIYNNNITNDVTTKNGITKQVLKTRGRNSFDVYSELVRFVQYDTIIFNNIEFICSFICKDVQLFNNKLIELFPLSKILLWNKINSFDLKTTSSYCNFKNFDKTKGAYNTCLATYTIYEYLKINFNNI